MVQEVDALASEVKVVCTGLLGRDLTAIERIGGGRNSKVYRLTCGDFTQYATKFYFRHVLDDRDRLGVEFSSLLFLWENGVRCIPRPIVADRDRGCAVYEYIDGKKISLQEVTNADIDCAVRFLTRLKELRNAEGSLDLPLASESCFSVQAIVGNIKQRLIRLSILPHVEPQYGALHEFLTTDLAPSFDAITKWCKANLSKVGISFVSELGGEERMLSPSDFGFHNALRRSDGQIIFLDFEYFGWDDPAKMVADFLLHPAMELSEDLKRRFATGILGVFRDNLCLARRIESVYPLFGLKWCLIFLNEFLPEHFLRRQFAGISQFKQHTLQMEQLSKAKQMLYQINQEYEHFPYFD